MQAPKKSRCLTHKDGDGYHFIVPEEVYKVGNSPRVDVWWNRGLRKRVLRRTKDDVLTLTENREELVLRQENGRLRADVVVVTPGQAYDLIDALCRALENP